MIRIFLLFLFLPGLLLGEDLMAGKTKTARTIHLEITVDCSPDEVFSLWSTSEGVRKFLSPDAHINPVEGGEYTILFAPKADPLGLSHGTKGARILKMIPGKFLAFEWITFAADSTLGQNAPPIASPETRNAKPLPTWVELSFDPVAGEPKKTHIKFAHYGFHDGDLWQKSFEWFSKAWDGVLQELAEYCKAG